MAAISTQLMTVEEFRSLPEDSGSVYHELRHGEIVPVTRPKYKHRMIQRRIRQLLEQFAPPDGVVDTEVAFRPLVEHELRVADVAYLCAERARTVDPEDDIRGAPDIVIEVLSPSNTASEMFEKEKLCLDNGASEFWVVDPERRQVKISTPGGHTIAYQAGQEIPLRLFGEASILVDRIFS